MERYGLALRVSVRCAVLLFLPGTALASDIPLSISAREAVARPGAVVTTGIPFPEGLVPSPFSLRVTTGTAEVPLQSRVTARWPDGSARWVLLDLVADLPAAPGSASLTLQTGIASSPASGVTVEDGATVLTVRTGTSTMTFQKTELAVGGLHFDVTSEGRSYRASPESWTVEESGPVKAIVRVNGRFKDAGGTLGNDLVGFLARLTFHRGSGGVRAALTFRNRGAFCWDAGGCTRSPGIVLSGATFGTALLGAGGRYVLGPGAEKTWDVLVAPNGTAMLSDSRYLADGHLAPGSVPPDPIASASPSWVAGSGAWGRVAVPVKGLETTRQEDFDRFEKLQRAKVSPADVENPPGLEGITLFGHLARDLSSWNDYGDLRWDGNGCGTLSGNHYDWSHGMALQFLRTGLLPFADAARLFARHEIDMDVYHTGADGAAFNFQKNWEDRPSHDSPDNCFGGGRPTHTWTQGYALHWLLTGNPRGRDAFEEIQEGIRQYLYESFNGEGHVSTSEIRTHGWLVDNLVVLYRIDPAAALRTTDYGSKSVPSAIKDVLEDVFAREAAAGGHGFVFDSQGDEPDPNLRAPLQHLYFIEPALKAYVEVFKGRDPAYATRLLGLVTRMTDWLISTTYGGDTDSGGLYRPRQIPFAFDVRQPFAGQGQGQVVYGLMAANAAAFLYLETGQSRYLEYARACFSDCVRYGLAVPGDTRVAPSLRSPAAYNSAVFTGTESKIGGWTSRYGQWVLAAEAAASSPALVASFTFSPPFPRARDAVQFTDTSPVRPVSWAWSFGGAGSSIQQNPTFSFPSPGTYVVSLRATDGSATSTATRVVTVLHRTPDASSPGNPSPRRPERLVDHDPGHVAESWER